MLTRRLSLMLPALVAFAGCAASQTYRLPMDASDAHSSFAQLAYVASNMGLQYAEHPTALNVKYDETTWIQYMVQGQQFNMVIVVDDKLVPPDQQPAKFSEAKGKGDEIWAKAMEARRQVLPGR